ncbi:MAG: hypothetical protein LLF78_01495 [Synergistaceae bacterium]|nr:hypothetical protein [Synergistaceae bacterium]
MSKYLAVYGKPRYLGIVEYDEEIKKGDPIIVESHRGEEMAIVAGELTPEQESSYRQLRNTSEHGDGTAKNVEPVVTDLNFLNFATDDDLKADAEYRREEDGILQSAKELLKPHELDMKLIDVEFLRGRRKLFFYFSSEQRVDFRAYVRDLAREFKTRIELRQIGVRDEAKVIKGIGPCGQPCCCSYWLNQFAPICIKMVKEQNLALNPAKISGICGRLMCCLCFEHNAYHEIWENLPNPGSKIKTPNGNVIVSGIELHTKSVRCYIPGRGEIKIPVDKFKEFRDTVVSGKEWLVQAEEIVPVLSNLRSVCPGCISSGMDKKKLTQRSANISPALERKSPVIEISEDRAGNGMAQKKAKKRQRKPPVFSKGAYPDHIIAAEESGHRQKQPVTAEFGDINAVIQPKARKPRHRRGHGTKKNAGQTPVQE